MRIAALLTCHNRRLKTLECLSRLHACTLEPGDALSVFLVDDGSTDGTAAAVAEQFPAVQVIAGDGNLFWNGGMRTAFAAAMAQGFDAYIWLNDDTMLYPDALRTLRNSGLAQPGPGIAVGATCDPHTGVLTYGGLVSLAWHSPHYYVHLPVAEHAQPCRTLNGNCVWIPASVAAAVGNLDPVFVHAIGDWDYGFRAARLGFKLWQAPGFVGECSQNPVQAESLADRANIRLQWRKVCSPKRIPPRAWRSFVRRHYGLLWPLYFLRPYLAVLARGLVAKSRLLLGRA